MNNKEKKNKKIIERLVGSFIEKNIIDNIDKDDVQLILDYLNGNLTKKEKSKVEKRLLVDDDFNFLLDITKFEISREKPGRLLYHYLLKAKLFFRGAKTKTAQSKDEEDEWVSGMEPVSVSQVSVSSVSASPMIASRTLVSYLAPALSVGMIIVLFFQMQPSSFNFNQFAYKMDVFDSKNIVRGIEGIDSTIVDSIHIEYDNDTLVINWKDNNPYIVANAVIVDEVAYFTKDQTIEVPFLMQKKFLKRTFERFTGAEKLKETTKIWSRNDTLEIRKIEFTSIEKLPANSKLNKGEIDYDKIGDPLAQKSFMFIISK